jgi:hypothetical protein
MGLGGSKAGACTVVKGMCMFARIFLWCYPFLRWGLWGPFIYEILKWCLDGMTLVYVVNTSTITQGMRKWW